MDVKEKLLNPANPPERLKVERRRIPMSLPHQRLAAPEIAGYHLHWMLGRPDRIQAALQGGYQFVTQEEIDLNRVQVGSGAESSGHTDLGSRVSVLSGVDETYREPQRLYLMKIPLELWEEDQAGLAARNESIAAAIRGEGFREPGGDNSHRYVPKDAGNRNLFTPKR